MRKSVHVILPVNVLYVQKKKEEVEKSSKQLNAFHRIKCTHLQCGSLPFPPLLVVFVLLATCMIIGKCLCTLTRTWSGRWWLVSIVVGELTFREQMAPLPALYGEQRYQQPAASSSFIVWDRVQPLPGLQRKLNVLILRVDVPKQIKKFKTIQF